MVEKTATETRTEARPPVPVDIEEVLDWDFCLETPPARPHGVVKARVEFRGRSKPLPVLEPDDEAS
jgi:hypothetical protein